MTTLSATPNLNRSPQAANSIDLACLFCVMVTSVYFHNNAMSHMDNTGSSIWQAGILAFVIGAAMVLLICAALKPFADDTPRDWFTVCENGIGKAGAKLSAVALLALCLDTCRYATLSAETIATNEFFAKTPVWVIAAIMLTAASVVAQKQLRGVVRTARLSLIIIVAILIALLATLFSHFDINRLFPILGYGLWATGTTALNLACDFFTDMLIICLLMPVKGGLSGTRRGLKRGIVIAAPLTIGIMLCYALALPAGSSLNQFPPLQQLALMSESGRYIERLPPLLVFVWAGAFITKISAMLFGAARSWAVLFGLSDEQPIIWPMAAIAFVTLQLPPSLLKLVGDRLPDTVRWALFAVALVPGLIGGLRKKRELPAAKGAQANAT